MAMTTVWESTITSIGEDAPEMFDAGVYILFGTPVPDALASIAIVHPGPHEAFAPVAVGDRFFIGDDVIEITAVGDLANTNFDQLGHICVYVNKSVNLLPGAIHGTSTATLAPSPGQRLAFERA